MAKPTGWSIYSAARPNIGNQHQESYQVSAQRSRRRWRPSRAPGPSSSVLSFLATIVTASSSADGSPLVVPLTPPSFLCPFIESDSCHENTDTSFVNIAKGASVVLPPTLNKRKTVQIADKFEQGPDGKWRKVDVYTLYGSTVCQNCNPSSTPGDGLNNAINPATPTTSPSPSTTPQPDKYTAVMPTGWSTSTNYDKPRTTVILCISLILALLMCAFMIAFVLWRRKQRKSRGNDEEMKLRKRRGQDVSEQEALMKKEARLKQKFWQRASARWKAHVQSSARRRINRRRAAAVQSTSLHDNSCPESLHRASSRSSSLSPASTPRRSLSADHSTTHVDGHATLGHSISTPSTDPVTASPPAYIQRGSSPPTQSKRELINETYLRTDHDPSGPLYPFSSIPRDIGDHESHPQYTPSINDTPLPYDDSYHAGHIATDDKTHLTRMAGMASAPPVEVNEGGSSTLQTSAPVLEDEQLLDGLGDTEMVPPHTSSTPVLLPSTSNFLFPPPPSKSKMAAPDFYDYPYSFEEDVSTIEPEMGPSAPPFEVHTPSAPPLEEAELRPSAPPLLEEVLASPNRLGG